MYRNDIPLELSREDFIKLKAAILKDITQNLDVMVEDIVYRIFGKLHDLPLTVPQVANLLGKAPKTVYKMCDRKQIPFSKVGNKVFINIKDINKKLILVDSQNES